MPRISPERRRLDTLRNFYAYFKGLEPAGQQGVIDNLRLMQEDAKAATPKPTRPPKPKAAEATPLLTFGEQFESAVRSDGATAEGD